jgi:hypothetical protein
MAGQKSVPQSRTTNAKEKKVESQSPGTKGGGKKYYTLFSVFYITHCIL